MLSPEESKKALHKWFRKRYISDLDQLFHVLETKSRMSVFRRLKLIGYLTSYTDVGRYYTLVDIPAFDSWGLWFYQGIGFSKAGTLKATVVDTVSVKVVVARSHVARADVLSWFDGIGIFHVENKLVPGPMLFLSSAWSRSSLSALME